MLASAADPDREDQARDPRQRQGDRDQFDQGEEEHPVGRQPDHRDHPEEAVIGEQEDDDEGEADDPGLDPVVERLRAEGRRDLGLGDQVQVDRQRADLQRGRQFLCRFEPVFAGESAGDLGPLAAVDAVRVFGEVDDRPALDFVVEDDREVAGEGPRLFGARRADRLRLTALGDLPGDVLEVFPPLVGEFEGDVRFARALLVFLLRFGDFATRKRRVVLQREPAGLGGFVDFPGFVRGQFGDQDRARGDLDHEPVFRQFFPGRAFVEVFFDRLRAGEQLVRRFLFEEVVLRLADRAGFAVFDRFLFGRQQRRRVGGGEGAGGDQAGVLEAFRVAPRFFPFFFELFDRAGGRLWPGWPPITRSGPIRFGSQSKK